MDNRRGFMFSVLSAVVSAAAACLPSVRSAAAESETRPNRITWRHQKGYLISEFSGDQQALLELHDIWQTELWPDWKTHKSPEARNMLSVLRKSWEKERDANRLKVGNTLLISEAYVFLPAIRKAVSEMRARGYVIEEIS